VEWNGMLSINSIYKEPYGIQKFIEFDASIDSNWSKEAHLGPREFVEITKASPNST